MTIQNEIKQDIPLHWDTKQKKLGASFLQSADWGRFQQSLGREVHTLQGKNWSALCIVHKTRLGTYWLVPAGPTVQPGNEQEALQTIQQTASLFGASWVRFELRGSTHLPQTILARSAPFNVQPVVTRCIDLTQPVDELRQDMDKKHRYSIKQFEKMGGYCEESRKTDDIKDFYAMYGRLADKTGGIFRSLEYLQKQAATMLPRGHMKLEFARDASGQIVAGCIIHSFAGVSSYVYAASALETRSTSGKGACHALIWHAMLQAKERGDHTFDLFGVAPPGDADYDSWAGFSTFKRRFGGKDNVYLPTLDIPLRSRYVFAYIYAQTKRFTRRYMRTA